MIKMGLEGQVKLLGIQSDISQQLVDSDIYVMCSMDEGFGLVIVEALASGLPIVVTNTGGMPEFIRDQINGFVVEPNDPSLLADAILKLCLDEQLCEQFGKAVLESSKQFNIRRMNEQYYQAYH